MEMERKKKLNMQVKKTGLIRRSLSLMRLSASGLLLINLLILPGSANAQKVEENIRHNPIIPDFVADPSISRFGDTYYCYITTDGYDKGLKVSGPPTVWTSKDLVNWNFRGSYFPSAMGQLYWAPSRVVAVKGKYYIYPTINRNIFVGISEHPGGPFRFANPADNLHGIAGATPIVSERAPLGTKGIDGEVFINDDNQAYLYWAQRGAAKLKPNMVEIDSTSITVIPTVRKGYSEGPIMFKRKGIYYYLYTLEGHEDYQYAYGYSTESPLGPFIFPANDIIAKSDKYEGIFGPGHGNVFYDNKRQQFYFTYLEFGNGGPNRQVYIDKIDFTEEGLIKPITLTHKGVGLYSGQTSRLNLAKGKKIMASSTQAEFKVSPIKDPSLKRTEYYDASNAVDENNATRWLADSGANEHATLILDLGKITKVSEIASSFVKPTAGHSYLLSYSVNGNLWKVYKKRDKLSFESPSIDKHKVNARYIKLTLLQGITGVWEIKVF